MTTNQSLDSAGDVIKADLSDGVSISDITVKKEEVEDPNETVVVKVEWTYDEEEYNKSNIKDITDTIPEDVQITRLTEGKTFEKVEDVQESKDSDLVNIAMVTNEKAQTGEIKTEANTNESFEVREVDEVSMTTNMSAAHKQEQVNINVIASDIETAIVTDVVMATPDVNSTNSMQPVKTGTETSKYVIGDKMEMGTGVDDTMISDSTQAISSDGETVVTIENVIGDKMETGTDVDDIIIFDSTPNIGSVGETVVTIETVTNDTVLRQDVNLDNKVIETNMTENENNSSVSVLVPEIVTSSTIETVVTDSKVSTSDVNEIKHENVSVVIDNIMTSADASLVVPGVIETIKETRELDGATVTREIITLSDQEVTSVSNDVKPEIISIIIDDSEKPVGHQELIRDKTKVKETDTSTKPHKREMQEVKKAYQSSETLRSREALLAYEFSDDDPKDQTSQLPLKKSKGTVMSRSSVKVYPTTMYGNTTTRNRKRSRKPVGKFIFDNQKALPYEITKLQMSDTSDIVTVLDLAPPTKKLMLFKEQGEVVQLFCLPGRRISSEMLSGMYTRNLITHSSEDNDNELNTIYVVEQDKKVEEEKPFQKKKKLITGRPEGLSVQVIDLQLKDTSQLVSALNLAPPTKQLMHWKETHDVKNLLSHPGRGITSRTISKLFSKSMVSKSDVGENEEEENEENIELEPLVLSECENGESENGTDITNETNGSVTS